MRAKLLILLSLVVVGGCNREPAPAPANAGNAAVTTAPTEEQKPIKYESSPLVVEAGLIAPQDPAVLAAASWTTKQCALTLPEGAADLLAAAGGPTRFAGFFIDPNDQPAGNFDIVLKGDSANYRIPVRTGWERADVGEYFKMPVLAGSGFEADVALGGAVPPGRYKVDFMVDRKGAKSFCESGKQLVVK